jgi:hypothetical protein
MAETVQETIVMAEIAGYMDAAIQEKWHLRR